MARRAETERCSSRSSTDVRAHTRSSTRATAERRASRQQGVGPAQNRLAKAIRISPNRIAEIVNNRRRITADTALRLALYFGNTPEYWLNLRTHYDLTMARQNLPPDEAKRMKRHRAA
jgi:addiction module HigA family antidote